MTSRDWRPLVTSYNRQTLLMTSLNTSPWRYTRRNLVMLGRCRKPWSVTEHRIEVSPIGYQALTPPPSKSWWRPAIRLWASDWIISTKSKVKQPFIICHPHREQSFVQSLTIINHLSSIISSIYNHLSIIIGSDLNNCQSLMLSITVIIY